jgi:hypothetical protein
VVREIPAFPAISDMLTRLIPNLRNCRKAMAIILS